MFKNIVQGIANRRNEVRMLNIGLGDTWWLHGTDILFVLTGWVIK